MGFHSQRILAQAGFSGVTFAAKILRCELPRYWLPRPEFAANVSPCSAPLKLEGSWKPLIFDFPHFNWINEMLFCEEKTKSFPSNYFFFGVDRKEGMCQAESEQERSRNPLGKTML